MYTVYHFQDLCSAGKFQFLRGPEGKRLSAWQMLYSEGIIQLDWMWQALSCLCNPGVLCRWANDHRDQAGNAEAAASESVPAEGDVREQHANGAASPRLNVQISEALNGVSIDNSAQGALSNGQDMSSASPDLRNYSLPEAAQKISEKAEFAQSASGILELPTLPNEAPTTNVMGKDLQQKLWRKRYDFTAADR